MPVQRTCSPARSTSHGPGNVTPDQPAPTNQVTTGVPFVLVTGTPSVHAPAQPGCKAVSA
jgi:hypothetical protein